MATKSQNLTFDEDVINEVIGMAATEKRNKSNMFNVLVREALEARYEQGFQADADADQARMEGL